MEHEGGITFQMDTRRWYDGFLYHIFYDPFEFEKRNIIREMIKENSFVLDVCCGTGALARHLAEKCRHVTGLELSSRMASHAKAMNRKKDLENINIVYGDASRLSQLFHTPFDYSVISLGLHEMPADIRVQVVSEMARVSRALVVSDYCAPQPRSMRGAFNYGIEFVFGGLSGFRRFLSFQKNGGVQGILEKAGLEIAKEKLDSTGTYVVIKTA